MPCTKPTEIRGRERTPGHYLAALRFGILLVCGVLILRFTAMAQAPGDDWRTEIRRACEARRWEDALNVAEREIALHPTDMDIRAWRARILSWSGKLAEAERELTEILKTVPQDADDWMELSNVYAKQGRAKDALNAIDRAVDLDPKRADLRSARGRILRLTGNSNEARFEFQRALALDSGSQEARSGLLSLEERPKHELRFGADNDLLSFADSNRNQWVSLVSRWTPHWTTSAAGSFYQRGGTDAANFVGSVTGTLPHWGAATFGGGTARDEGVVPRTEAFFELDHGLKVGESGWVRGMEIVYGQHWYWYSTARILTLSETAMLYLPGRWTWSIRLTEVRNDFSNTNVDWKPSGLTRLGYPLGKQGRRSLSGNLFYAIGTEDFAQVDQIGSFASQTYGAGLRFQITARQDVSGYAAFQQRTQDRRDLGFGFSYGIRF